MYGVFFFNDTATTEIYTLSLHDALPIYRCIARVAGVSSPPVVVGNRRSSPVESIHASASQRASRFWIREATPSKSRSEEHTSELQSRQYLVCRLLLEKKTTSHCLSFFLN